MAAEGTIKPSDGFEYYDPATIFFNTFTIFARDWNRQISGDPGRNWIDHVKARYGRFEAPLFVSCGNGAIERDCYRNGLISSVEAFDIMPELIDVARKHADEIGMPAQYSLQDGNKVELQHARHDLVVNHAACHHIANIDRLTRQIWRSLAPGGIYVMLDYTGPHRNQYSWNAWQPVLIENAALPEKYRTPIRYPHMATMLALDPTEAIHSELIMEVTQRYFDLEQHVALGGGLLHPLLQGKAAMLADQNEPDVQFNLERLRVADRLLTDTYPETNLFTFAICCPKPPETVGSPEMLAAWSREEQEREAAAIANSGLYYPSTTLKLIYDDLIMAEYLLSVANA